MKTREENTFWKWVNEKFHEQIDELRDESVARTPKKASESSDPPVPPRLKDRLKR